MFGFVVVGKDHFSFLYLKLEFACVTKEFLIQFDFLSIFMVAAFETVGEYVKVSYAKLVFSFFF